MIGMFRSLATPLLASALCALPALGDPSPAFLVKDLDATVSGSNVFNPVRRPSRRPIGSPR
jgi:hypothetical protein